MKRLSVFWDNLCRRRLVSLCQAWLKGKYCRSFSFLIKPMHVHQESGMMSEIVAHLPVTDRHRASAADTVAEPLVVIKSETLHCGRVSSSTHLLGRVSGDPRRLEPVRSWLPYYKRVVEIRISVDPPAWLAEPRGTTQKRPQPNVGQKERFWVRCYSRTRDKCWWRTVAR